MAQPLFIYIHGFNSSPDSYKARFFVDWMTTVGRGDQVLVPALPHWPATAMVLLEQLIETHRERHIVLVGSSLGGYYSTWLSEKYGLPAVLINPAVRPFELLAAMLGEQGNYYSDEQYELTAEHLQQLLALNCRHLQDPSRYLLLTQTGDETLDYREAVEKFKDSPMLIQQGGNHGFDQFESVIPTILAFAEGRIELPAVTELTSPADKD
ncbi:YqiA/YcfP family alpha/beta fold hydrolase [Amphritea sp. 1_MG-2023]|uniref:YqiA/YcfP family alpha/beta fold hydrolase n=1 Tax=Amphritea sp. 1_MG-2023 TaxID=3062670 RepID=UPI0026E3A8DE|nr:YqiA/YcfP family alpha/beta fold hydrolase [Amphritea sp. 1_MG-2023]MDO6563261.1 YqiA/YcfP family alpha/beta fold hydrolase [Amphritea sp. 1_MG-2023]